MMSDYTVIHKTSALEAFCFSALESGVDVVAVDTEFMSGGATYFAELCLIQLATRTMTVVVDPLAKGMDLTPLADLLTHRSVLKVFHAAFQDVELFHRQLGVVPTPIFDTQIGAMGVMPVESIGFASLHAHYFGGELDKSQQRTDWAKRPLQTAQLDYAARDARYLLAVYDRVWADLINMGRQDWGGRHHQDLMNPALYRVDPALAYRRLKMPSGLDRDGQIRARFLAAIREEQAITYNKPRRTVCDDPLLMVLIQSAATDWAQVTCLPVYAAARQKHLMGGMTPSSWDGLMGAFQAAHHHVVTMTDGDKESFLPTSAPPTPWAKKTIQSIKAICQKAADNGGIAPSLLANARDIENLVQMVEAHGWGDGLDHPLLRGWRWDLTGQAIKVVLSKAM